MVSSYQDSHGSKKNLTKKPNMARKIYYELLDIDIDREKKQNQKNIKLKVMEKSSRNQSKQ